MRDRRNASTAAGVGLIAGSLALGVWLYAATLKGLALEWASSPDSSYGLILAAIAAIVTWRRRSSIAAALDVRSNPTLGLLLLVAGLFSYLVGFLGADVFITRLSFVLVLTGAVGLLAGPRVLRLMAAPLCFLALAIPLPALVVNTITLPMQLVASRLAEGLLTAGGLPVFRDGNILELPSTSLEVAEACSGLRSLISLTAVACLVAWAEQRTIGRRALVIASAVPIAIVLNGVRIAATGVACETWGRRAASGGWHTFSGWVTFVAATAILLQVPKLFAFRRRAEAAWPATVART